MKNKTTFKKCLSVFGLLGCFFFVASLNAQVEEKQQDSETVTYPMNHPMRNAFSGSVQLPKSEKEKVVLNEKKAWCSTQAVNRTQNGRCNNVSSNSKILWGSADRPLLRVIPDVYNSNNDLVGQNRKNPREISNIIFESDCGPSSTRLSSFVFSWGQFLDHDISVSPEDENESEPILPVPNDIITAPIPFHRSEAYPGTGAREQKNILTAWIDGSNVYGSDITRANYLRTFWEGKLKVSTSANGDLLPLNTVDNQSGSTIDTNAPFMAGNENQMTGAPVEVFVAGDLRANEQTGLTSLHTLFMREHNRICDQLVASGMTDDEAIYQQARKEVGALIQSITYNEFLPALGVQVPTYAGYDDAIQPDIMNVFSTAAFRLGHTMVTDHILLYDDNGNNTGNLSLAEAFFNPGFVLNNGIETVLNGLAQQFQEETDAQIVENLRSFLFTPTPTGPGLDLAALNIQRGRDHGLDDYNAFRSHFLGNTANSFNDITTSTELKNELILAYNNDINDIDVWVGLLAEDRLPNAAIGATLNAILSDQFSKLRDGDFYYFENDPTFTTSQKNTINNTTLSDIIKRNTNINNIKNQVFYAPCPNTRTLNTANNINNGVQTYKTVTDITASNVIDNTSQAVYDAGVEITFLPGFEAHTGSDFHALINGCDSNGFNKKGTQAFIEDNIPQTTVRNSPNPFSDFTIIEYTLNQQERVNMTIYDINGKKINQLMDNQLVEEGRHTIEFKANNLPNGVYYCILITDKEQQAIKMVVQK